MDVARARAHPDDRHHAGIRREPHPNRAQVAARQRNVAPRLRGLHVCMRVDAALDDHDRSRPLLRHFTRVQCPCATSSTPCAFVSMSMSPHAAVSPPLYAQIPSWWATRWM
eukprot:2876891-Prymnesium_polylepis.1